jgi:hypothetical protein
MRASIDVASIGAGPYGLTLAHGLTDRGMESRISGKPLGQRIQSALHVVNGVPTLSANYESSALGPHFIEPISAESFGLVSRFVFGTTHPSRLLPRYRAKAQPLTSGGVLEPAVLSLVVPQ